jgi:hypothetical protein
MTEISYEEVETKLSEFDRRMEPRIAGLETRLSELDGRIEARVTGLEAGLSNTDREMEARIAGLETRLPQLEARVPNWIQRNAPAISAIVALFGLAVGGWYYAKQVGFAQRSLQNNLIYQMQKDQRAAIMDYGSSRSGPEYIFAQMQSIFIQRSLGSIADDVWTLFLRDFCGVMRHENFRRSWEDLSKDAFSQDFIAFMGHIKDPGSLECRGEKK